MKYLIPILAVCAALTGAAYEPLTNLAARVASASTAIDAAIVAKGGTTTGGLEAAPAAIAALPAGGEEYDGEDMIVTLDLVRYPAPSNTWSFGNAMFTGTIDWGDGNIENVESTYKTVTHTYATNGVYTAKFSTPNATMNFNDWGVLNVNSIVEVKISSKMDWYSPVLKNNHYTIWYNKNGVKATNYSLNFLPRHPSVKVVGALRWNAESFGSGSSESIIFNGSFTDVVLGPSCVKFAKGAYENNSAPRTFVCANTNMAITSFGMANYSKLIDIICDTLTVETESCEAMFKSCTYLDRIPTLIFTNAITSTKQMFYGCSSLLAVPDVLDLTACTTAQDMFYGCSALVSPPTHLTAQAGYSLAISFANSSNLDETKVAEFNADGEIVGGMAYNLNDLTGQANPPTVTFHANVKTRINDAHPNGWEAVKAAFAAKGWNISPAN